MAHSGEGVAKDNFLQTSGNYVGLDLFDQILVGIEGGRHH